MMWFGAIAVVVGFAVLVHEYWTRVFGPQSSLGSWPFRPWVTLGLIIPASGWLLINLGMLPGLPPLIPEVAVAQSHGDPWAWLYLRLTVPGLLLTGSYWAAVAFLHFNILIGIQTESRQEFWIIVAVLSLLTCPVVAPLIYYGKLGWLGVASLVWLVPVTHCTAFLVVRSQTRPIYARAIARMKLGKYTEAEAEVIQQLELYEEDFDGWMMLAELYATQFRDLTGADRTVRALCAQSNITALQVSLALHRLADWHLKFGMDPVRARAALREIESRLPGTHFARMAEQRLRQLPATAQEWQEQQRPKSLRLPALTGDLTQGDTTAVSQLSRRDAATLANECVERLRHNPNDPAPREKLALLLVESLNKPELGLEQLDLLLEMPGLEDKQKAEWLSRKAGWQWRYLHDGNAVKKTLARLIGEYPQTVQAFAAQRWLNLLEMEQRHSRTNAAVARPLPSS